MPHKNSPDRMAQQYDTAPPPSNGQHVTAPPPPCNDECTMEDEQNRQTSTRDTAQLVDDG